MHQTKCNCDATIIKFIKDINMKVLGILMLLYFGLSNAFGVRVVCNYRHPRRCYYKEKFYVGYYPRWYRGHQHIIIVRHHHYIHHYHHHYHHRRIIIRN